MIKSILHGFLFPGTHAELKSLRDKVQALYKQLEEISKDPDLAWLYRNRYERMDATREGIFEVQRREFHLARYQFAAQYTNGLKVADIASGTGYGSALLKKSGSAREVVGIDIDPDAVAYAKNHHSGPELTFKCANGTDTELESHCYDAITSFETLEHLDQPEALLNEFRRLLKPGGMLIISVPNAWSLEDAPFHRLCMGTDEIAALLKKFFKHTTLWAQNSGSSFKYNHNQPAGITPLCRENTGTAECVIAVCHD